MELPQTFHGSITAPIQFMQLDKLEEIFLSSGIVRISRTRHPSGKFSVASKAIESAKGIQLPKKEAHFKRFI